MPSPAHVNTSQAKNTPPWLWNSRIARQRLEKRSRLPFANTHYSIKCTVVSDSLGKSGRLSSRIGGKFGLDGMPWIADDRCTSPPPTTDGRGFWSN